MAQMNMKEAIRDAMRVELKRDPNVLVFGKTSAMSAACSVRRKVCKRIWR